MAHWQALLGLWVVALSAAAGPSPGSPACEATGSRAPASAARLTLLGSLSLPRTDSGPARHLGGLSGIDYDPDSGTWWLLSDDKGEHAPPRAYPTWLSIGPQGISQVQIGQAVQLPLHPAEIADPEALRRHPCLDLWVWASEGHLARAQPPSVRWLQWPPQAASADRAAGRMPTPSEPASARPLGSLALPRHLHPGPASASSAATGPRPNRNIEGLAFTPSADALWVALESPLLQDGPEPDARTGAWLRFTRLPLAGGPAAQYAYPVEPIQRPATGGLRRADNGVSEILTLASGELLVVERNGYEVADSRWSFGARLFIADARQATDVSALSTLQGADIRPMRKRLLLDLASLGLPHLDNIEAAAWGPRLPDGRAVLLLASDDNFAPNQVTQLIALAVEDAP